MRCRDAGINSTHDGAHLATTVTSRRAQPESAGDTSVSVAKTAVRIESFRDDVLRGLRLCPKALNPKYFYDERGSRLFDRICELDEYYLTRVELSIMRAHADEMAAELGEECCLIEFGSGSGLKTRILLRHMKRPAAYVPVDIALDHLAGARERLRDEFPQLSVLPVCADFTQSFELPHDLPTGQRRAVYFPGSTIGNFEPDDARRLLRMMAGTCGPGGGVLIGVDLKKDRETLERAYNDAEGVTARFNLNILTRMNRELGADFVPARWRHRAAFNEAEGRIEMHLVSTTAQTVHIDGVGIPFAANESIHTESSHKYELDQFAAMARAAGLKTRRVWTDPDDFFSVHHLVVE